MIISVVNHTSGRISDEEVQHVLRAINRQIKDDFEPYWSLGAELRLEGRSTYRPSIATLPDLRGEAILYLWDKQANDADPLGYHDKNARGIPYGFVFTEVAAEIPEPWSVGLSHEALELIADPEVNLLVKGPHPEKGHEVYHWYEMCDAVQAEHYTIDDVAVSNFVLPLYFTSEAEPGGRNDFLGRAHSGKTLESFGVNPCGYIGYFDPKMGRWGSHTTYFSDEEAEHRNAVRGKAGGARRGKRYTEDQGRRRKPARRKK